MLGWVGLGYRKWTHGHVCDRLVRIAGTGSTPEPWASAVRGAAVWFGRISSPKTRVERRRSKRTATGREDFLSRRIGLSVRACYIAVRLNLFHKASHTMAREGFTPGHTVGVPMRKELVRGDAWWCGSCQVVRKFWNVQKLFQRWHDLSRRNC